MPRSDSLASLRNHSNGLYAKLAVPPDASTERIEAAYRVLEQAYRPDGAYIDDAMHLAFKDISRAASILANPKTRKLYDRGYIDDFGRRTEAGLTRAAKLRRAAVALALLAGGLAGVAGLASGIKDKENQDGAGQARIQGSIETSPPALAPRTPDGTQKTVSTANPALPPSADSAPLRTDERDYLPPETVMRPRKRIAGSAARSSEESRTPRLYPTHKSPLMQSEQPRPGNQNARTSEPRRLARLSRTGPRTVQSYIWFGAPVSPPGPAPASQTLRSARCLACLTDSRADCSRACP